MSTGRASTLTTLQVAQPMTVPQPIMPTYVQQPVVTTIAPQPVVQQHVVQPVAAVSTGVSYGMGIQLSTIAWWILLVLIIFFIVIGILFFLQVSLVTDTLPSGEVVINTGKLLLWGIIFTVIILFLLWLFSRYTAWCGVGKVV
jgi:hypothetical protein